MSTFKGHLSAKMNQVKLLVQELDKAVANKPRNDLAANRLSLRLQDDLDILLKADMKHQLSVDAYQKAGEGNAEAEQEFYRNLPDDREAIGKQVEELYSLASRSICKCPAPPTQGVPAASSPVVKPEKELKPDNRLEEGDSITSPC